MTPLFCATRRSADGQALAKGDDLCVEGVHPCKGNKGADRLAAGERAAAVGGLTVSHSRRTLRIDGYTWC